MQLFEAAAVGWMDEVVKLLDQGTDVNATEGVRHGSEITCAGCQTKCIIIIIIMRRTLPCMTDHNCWYYYMI